VAVKLPTVAPAATIKDAGAVSAALLVEIATAVPPAGAACDMVTVQVVLLPDVTEVGVQLRAETVGGTETAIVPPVPVTPSATPAPDVASALLIGSDTTARLVVLSQTETVATTPLGMLLVFIPEVRHVKVPPPMAQLKVLPAPTSAAPAVALIETTSLAEYEMVHCSPAGEIVPATEERLRETSPPCTADPDESASEPF
jgi:hypothetical protein